MWPEFGKSALRLFLSDDRRCLPVRVLVFNGDFLSDVKPTADSFHLSNTISQSLTHPVGLNSCSNMCILNPLATWTVPAVPISVLEIVLIWNQFPLKS